MPSFTYRQLNLTDIAEALGKTTSEITLTTSEDGVITVTVPSIGVSQKAILKAFFESRGFVEDPAAIS